MLGQIKRRPTRAESSSIVSRWQPPVVLAQAYATIQNIRVVVVHVQLQIDAANAPCHAQGAQALFFKDFKKRNASAAVPGW